MRKLIGYTALAVALLGIVVPKHVWSHQAAGALPVPSCGPGVSCQPPPCGK